ncbi:hypothetical protein [Clostridium sp. AM58-1XD]|uniref:hypothetical protein n=1 Tax=Clostridium sp. AM58-1XD TaxID=2292307 RepID=UPI000E47EA57|nr:hypothetical protein [Clostridium sp. AM58-1XD]RGY98268.1 hypothetical protein DXA13_12055 [Clostridium sp. AM58-1XD]
MDRGLVTEFGPDELRPPSFYMLITKADGLDFQDDISQKAFLPPYYTDFKVNSLRVPADILYDEKDRQLSMSDISMGTRARAHIKRHGEEGIDEIDKVIVYTEEFKAKQPTGMYGVGQPMLMVHGRLYSNPQPSTFTEPPDGYEWIGTVMLNSSEQLPQQDFEACHISAESEIYQNLSFNSDIILVSENGRWFTMTPMPTDEKVTDQPV